MEEAEYHWKYLLKILPILLKVPYRGI